MKTTNPAPENSNRPTVSAPAHGSASPTPRSASYWNELEPQCGDASQLAEAMYEWSHELERESERRRKDILRWVHRYETLRDKMPNSRISDDAHT